MSNTKLEVLESNLLVVDWVIYSGVGVIYYIKLEVLESNFLVVYKGKLLWLGGGGYLLHINCYTNY